jgi:N-glycosidase YbiA
MGTGDAVLLEHTTSGGYCPDGGDESGRNMLGQTIMEIRVKLRAADEPARSQDCGGSDVIG